MEKLGALWANRDKNDDEYFSGQIEVDGNVIPIIVFSNGFKEEEKHPDLIIYLREEREGNGGGKKGGYNKGGGYSKGGGYKSKDSGGDRQPNRTPNRAGSGGKKPYSKGGASKKSAYSRKGKG